MTTTKPIFLLLHGAWHTPACWSRLIPLLNDAGYETVAPNLPSSVIPPNKPTSSWDADIEVIRSNVTNLAKDKGRDVIIVAHSFSGMTAGTALGGLDKKSCVENGWKGGIVRLVYICAFVVPEGFQHSSQGTRENMVPEMKVDFEAGIVTVAPEDVRGLLYQDLGEEEVQEVAKTLVPMSLGAFWSKTTEAAWRVVPTTFVVTLGDKESTVQAAEWMVKSAREGGKHCVERVVRREVGHGAFWSQAKWCKEFLIEEALNV